MGLLSFWKLHERVSRVWPFLNKSQRDLFPSLATMSVRRVARLFCLSRQRAPVVDPHARSFSTSSERCLICEVVSVTSRSKQAVRSRLGGLDGALPRWAQDGAGARGESCHQDQLFLFGSLLLPAECGFTQVRVYRQGTHGSQNIIRLCFGTRGNSSFLRVGKQVLGGIQGKIKIPRPWATKVNNESTRTFSPFAGGLA